MPRQQRLRRDDARHLGQPFASQPFRLGGQATPLVVGQPQSPITELLAQHAVLFPQIVDHLLLRLMHPPGHRYQQEPERI